MIRRLAFLVVLAIPVLTCCGRPAGESVHAREHSGDRQEGARLARLKEERVEELEGRLRGASGEQRMGILLQIAYVGSARAFAIVDQNIDSVRDRPTLLNAAAAVGSVEARPLMQRAIDSWGPEAGHPIERLHFVFGPEIAPELRKRLAAVDSREGAVGRAIRTELVRLKDPRAVTALRNELAGLAVDSKEDALRAIDAVSRAMECSESAADVGRLFQRVDERRSDVHRQLKQYAAGVALWLGDQTSAEHVIDLLASPGSDYFDYPGLFTLQDILKRQTRHSFSSPAEWKAWWTSQGRSTPLFTVHVSPTEEAAIINAVVAWGRSAAAGPVIRDTIAYLQLDYRTFSDRETIRAGLDPPIHAYRSAEIALLGKAACSVLEIETNGLTAFATLGDGSNETKWRLTRLELRRERGRWAVVGRDSSRSR